MMLHDQPIRTREEAESYIRALFREGLDFHFEDDPSEIIRRDGSLLFTPEEWPLVRQRVAELYAIEDWGQYDCPIGYSIEVQRFEFVAAYFDRADELYKHNGEGVTRSGTECHRQFVAHAREWLRVIHPEDDDGPFQGDHGSVGIDHLTAEELLIAMYG